MVELTGYILLFVGLGIFFVFIHLMMGKLIRPARPDVEKLTIYECGEPTIGSSWIQFDLRFYVVALLFVIFDVEVVFFFPWAVVFGKATALARPDLPAEQRIALTDELVPPAQRALAGSSVNTDQVIQPPDARQLAWFAFWDILVFFGVLLVGFAYLWKRGDLDWVRSTAAERGVTLPADVLQPLPENADLVAAR
jgi:NADH-quinone oxidoreductase subunit A